jgi:hypothetical protein
MKRLLLLSILLLAVAAPASFAQPALLETWSVGGHVRELQVGPGGIIYVSTEHGISAFADDGTFLGSGPDLQAGFDVAANGEIFGITNGTVLRFSAGGALLGSWDVEGAGGIAVHEQNVYVRSVSLSRIARYTVDGEHITDWSSEFDPWAGPPLSLDVDSNGDVFITDGCRVTKFSPAGQKLFSWDNEIDENGEHAYDLALDYRGNVYVTPSYRHGYIHVYGNRGGILGRFQNPEIDHHGQIGVNGSGNIFLGVEDSVVKLSPYGSAQPPAVQAAILLHVAPVDRQGDLCAQVPASAEEIVTEGIGIPGQGGSFYVYLLASPEVYIDGLAGGITGMQTGIEYKEAGPSGKGVNIHSWNRCSILDFPQDSWPGSGSGNTITWSVQECQTQEIVSGGFFYLSVYSPSKMSIVDYPPTGLSKVAGCQGAEMGAAAPLDPIRLGWIALAESGGCNPLLEPCRLTSTEPITWGRLKALYR